MASFDPHIFDLPLELLFEVIKHLDTKSISKLALTCRYFKDKVEEFKILHEDLLAFKKACENARPAGYDDEDEDDLWSNNDHLSQGEYDEEDHWLQYRDNYDSDVSYMDEELEEYMGDD